MAAFRLVFIGRGPQADNGVTLGGKRSSTELHLPLLTSLTEISSSDSVDASLLESDTLCTLEMSAFLASLFSEEVKLLKSMSWQLDCSSTHPISDSSSRCNVMWHLDWHAIYNVHLNWLQMRNARRVGG